MDYAELITETEIELTELECKQKLVQFQKRVKFLIALKSRTATTQQQAGAVVGWKLRQSQKMWQLYRLGGTRAMLHKNARWQTGKLSDEQRGQLERELTQEVGGSESLAALQQRIQTSFGVSYTIGGVSGLCQRLRIKLKTARPVNVLKDEQRAVEYKKTLVR